AAIVVYAARHRDGDPGARREEGHAPAPSPGWRPRLRLISVTISGGYVVFLAIVLVFHTWIVGQRGALRSALHGGTFLALVCAVTFIAASVLEARLGRGSAW